LRSQQRGRKISEEDKELTDQELKEEREKLKELGVTSTWDLLTNLTKKKKE
jgi:uncharacterized protein YpuA (DUF1002 family)